MASEQCTEPEGKAATGPPVIAEGVDGHLLRSFLAREGQREVVTRALARLLAPCVWGGGLF